MDQWWAEFIWPSFVPWGLCGETLVCHIQMTNIMLDGQQRELALGPSLWFCSQYLKHPFSEGGKLDKSLEEMVLLLVMLWMESINKIVNS